MLFWKQDAASAQQPAYKYSPLPGPRSIRILVLKYGARGEPLQCELEAASLDDTPRYAALSYSWGMNKDGDASLCREIHIKNRSLRVTRNLYEGLLRLREHQWLCSPGGALRIWIDAACINQEDAQERGPQVAMMADIYSRAERLLIWLGENSGDKRTEEALQWISQDGCTTRRQWSYWHQNAESMLRWRYFKRRWVVQEIYHSRPGKTRIFWGPCYIEFNVLKDIVQAFDIHWRRDGRKGQPILENVHSIKNLLSMTETKMDLRAALRIAQGMECSDERDIVYSLFGLADMDIRPNYTKNVAQAFTAAARVLITQGLMSVLFSNLTRSRQKLPDSSKLPSWVPDFGADSHLDWHTNIAEDPVGAERSLNAAIEGEGTLVYAPHCIGRIRKTGKTESNETNFNISGADPTWVVDWGHPLRLRDGDLLCMNWWHVSSHPNRGIHVLRSLPGRLDHYEIVAVLDGTCSPFEFYSSWQPGTVRWQLKGTSVRPAPPAWTFEEISQTRTFHVR